MRFNALPFGPARLLDRLRRAEAGFPLPMPRRGPGEGEPSAPLARAGSLEVRLARDAGEVRRAQRLRYRVFYEERSAQPGVAARLRRLDQDGYDAICDHLLVIDHAPEGPGAGRPPVVGTYRLLRQEVAARHGGFYSQAEFDLAPVIAAHPALRFLELGRSCVRAGYRDARTVALLWHGIMAYVARHRLDVMFGCASFDGVEPRDLAVPLSYLHHHALSPPEWRARAVEARRVAMDLLPPETVEARAALRALPPLLKGYLRAGATFGDGAVIDRAFGTVDVLVMLPVPAISPRYRDHFGG